MDGGCLQVLAVDVMARVVDHTSMLGIPRHDVDCLRWYLAFLQNSAGDNPRESDMRCTYVGPTQAFLSAPSLHSCPEFMKGGTVLV